MAVLRAPLQLFIILSSLYVAFISMPGLSKIFNSKPGSPVDEKAPEKVYYPANDPPIGTLLPEVGCRPYYILTKLTPFSFQADFAKNAKNPILFQPLKLRNVTFKNRIQAVSAFSDSSPTTLIIDIVSSRLPCASTAR